MSGVQVNASFGSNTKEESESPHNILVLFFDCKERERGTKEDPNMLFARTLVLTCFFDKEEPSMPAVDEVQVQVGSPQQRE